MYPNISWPSSLPNTPPEPLQSPRSRVSSESSTPVPVYINNQAIYVPKRLKADVYDAADRIRSNWFNALSLKKEVLLDPDILIPLLNHSKLYWYTWLANQPAGSSATQRLESVFVNNINLSKKESDWVRETIRAYKNNIELAIAQNSLNTISPTPLPEKKNCFKALCKKLKTNTALQNPQQ